MSLILERLVKIQVTDLKLQLKKPVSNMSSEIIRDNPRQKCWDAFGTVLKTDPHAPTPMLNPVILVMRA